MKIYVVCQKGFCTNSGTQKSCSIECREKWNIQRAKIAYVKKRGENGKLAVCQVCGIEFNFHFRIDRGDRKFCGRSCASKHYIQSGIYDSWRTRANPKIGHEVKCLFSKCTNLVYLPPRYFDESHDSPRGRLCSFSCECSYFSEIFQGEKNPMFGVKMSRESLAKQKLTLQRNHPGVSNAFMLASRRTKTKPQIRIFEAICERFPDLNFEIEKRVVAGSHELFADIVSLSERIVIEFNGDFWHCNPEKYEATYLHPKKNMTAQEIWSHDCKR